MKKKNKVIILLTATIDPKGIVFLKRNDPLVRENDYINSIKLWIENSSYPIVFCENSGYNIENIKNIIEKSGKEKIEILQFDGQKFPRELGKGYGELLIIKYALQNSSIINNSEFVIKVTGRYFIKNIHKIADILEIDKDVFIMVDLIRNLTWADTRVFAFKPQFCF